MNWAEIAIVGGGCYGTFYARQLARAKEQGKASYRNLLVVDRDPRCRMIRELGEADDRRLVVAEWDAFFDQFLDAEIAPQFQMRPVKQRIAQGLGNGPGPGLEFFPR